MLFTEVDPESFIKQARHEPAHGRGAWTAKGQANGSWRYEYIKGKPLIGTNAETSLDAWATCAGCYGYQTILMASDYLRWINDSEKGIFGTDTRDAVKAFQAKNVDPENGAPLQVDGTIGKSDARALLTPLIDKAEQKYNIPRHYLRGETRLESALDCGALGYYIYYGDDLRYAGVDRSSSQINSEAHPEVSWHEAFKPAYAIDWSGARMRDAYDRLSKAYPNQRPGVLWDAAICNHNSPAAALAWAKNGVPPTDTAARYVQLCKAARY